MAALLTPILGESATEQARILLDRFGNISVILRASKDALSSALANDLAAAEALLAARELFRIDLYETLVSEMIAVGDPRLKSFLVGELQNSREERLVAIYLDDRKQFILSEHVGIGSSSSLSIRTRSLVHRILELNASKIILAHNHPSGLARPSASDRHATANFEQIVFALGIELLDHCIVAGGEVFSMRLGKVL